MALLPQQRKFIKNVRHALWFQGIYWKEGRDSAFIHIIAPGATYSDTYMERVKDLTRPDPEDMEHDDEELWDLIRFSFDLSIDLNNFPSGEELEKIALSYIKSYAQDYPFDNYLLYIDNLNIDRLANDTTDIDLLYLNNIKNNKKYLPHKLQTQFDINLQSPIYENITNEDRPSKPEIELLRGYIESKNGNKEAAIRIFEDTPWKRIGRTPKENTNSSDTGLLQIIKKTVENQKVGDKSSWKNEDLFLLITTHLKYTRNYQQLMYDWLNQKNERESDKESLKINIANTLKFEFSLWKNWGDNRTKTVEVINECIIKLKKHYNPPKSIYKPSFSTTITQYEKIPKDQKEILTKLSLADTPKEIKEIFAQYTGYFTKNQEYQSFLRKATDILFEKGEYILLNGWIIQNLFSDVKDTPEMSYLIAHMYGSGQLGETEDEKRNYYELACNMLLKALNESRENNKLYADLNTSAISNDLRSLLPNLEDPELRKSIVLDFTSHYLNTFKTDTDYYPGINFAYMLSLSKELYPKVRRFNNESIENVYNISKISLEVDQNSHKPYNTRHNRNTYTIANIAQKLNMPTENVKNYIKNAKLTFPNTQFRNLSDKTILTKSDYDKILTAIENRDKRYYSHITENEFLALNDLYSSSQGNKLLEILYDIQPTKDQLNRTLRQLYLYQYMLEKGNKEPNNSIMRLVEDLKSVT